MFMCSLALTVGEEGYPLEVDSGEGPECLEISPSRIIAQGSDVGWKSGPAGVKDDTVCFLITFCEILCLQMSRRTSVCMDDSWMVSR